MPIASWRRYMARGPLQRRRIVITRPRDRAERLAGELRALGAATLVLPLVRIEATEEVSALAAVLADLDGSDWVVFTSASGVSAVGELMTELGAAKVAAVGPATAAALRDIGVEPSFVPGRFAAEEIVAGLEPLAGARVLLPQADLADRGLADGLRDRGANVSAMTAYRTVPVERTASELAELRAADAVVLASGSAARSLALQGGAGDALVACIGPKTAEIAREVGLPDGIVADEATAKGIIHALVGHFEETTEP